MYTVWVISCNSLSGPVPVFEFLFLIIQYPWLRSHLSKHSCRGYFAHHILIFIPIFGDNKSPGYFLIDWIWRGCKKLSPNLSPWPKEGSYVSADQVLGCFHRFFIAGRQENCQIVTKEEMEDESSKHCPDSKDEVACQCSSVWVSLESLSDFGNSEPEIITRVWELRICQNGISSLSVLGWCLQANLIYFLWTSNPVYDLSLEDRK